IDNARVRDEQVARLAEMRLQRDPQQVEATLAALRSAAGADGNLLAASIDAARARASLGEISAALEDVFGRYHATTRVISGVYGSEYADDPQYTALLARIESFRVGQSRPPSIFIAKMGQ